MEQESPLFDVSKVQEKLKNVKSLSDLTGSNGVIQEMIKTTVERILKAEQEVHLGYEPYKKPDSESDNSRNGYSKKTLKTSSGEVEIEVPRDRKGSFNPQFVQKHQSFDPDLENRITGMYARGMNVRDIQSQLEEFYGTSVSPLKARGVKDILIACVDGLKGFPEAIANIFPQTMVQLCIVHQIRASLRYMASKYHKEFTKDLKEIYRASNIENAEEARKRLEGKWGTSYPAAVSGWKNNWHHLSTFFSFPMEIRKMIYTTNAVEALHRQFRKVTKTKGAFPTDDSLKKMLYLATLDLKGALRGKSGWAVMLGQLKLIFKDRIPENVV